MGLNRRRGLKQELVSLVMTAIPAYIATPESGLVLEENTMIPTRVVTRHDTHQIMETNKSKPWDTS